MSGPNNYFETNYEKIQNNIMLWFPSEIKDEASQFEPTLNFAYQKLSSYIQPEQRLSIKVVLVTEHDWSKTPEHDVFPYGLAYLSERNPARNIYISYDLPDYYLVEDNDLNRAMIAWHEIARIFMQPPNFPFPESTPHWLTEGLPQLAVWTLISDSQFDCRPIEPVEIKLRDQTHFTILEYEPSTPVKPARFAKYQWLLLFMMRDLTELHREKNGGQLLTDILPVLSNAPKRLDYLKTMDLLSNLLKLNVGDWLSTRWYF